jgi:hypothetical protein
MKYSVNRIIIWMMESSTIAYRSIAKKVDKLLLEIRCVCCHHLLCVTFEEVRLGKVIPCPNCEAWLPLWDMKGMFQDLFEQALSVDRAIEASCNE